MLPVPAGGRPIVPHAPPAEPYARGRGGNRLAIAQVGYLITVTAACNTHIHMHAHNLAPLATILHYHRVS